MREEVFLDRGRVLVTTTRLVVNGRTFAISGINSVSIQREQLKLGWQVVVAFLGAVVLLGGLGGDSTGVVAFGFLMIVAALVWAFFSWPRHYVSLEMAGRESVPLSRLNRQLVLDVVDALNRAIVARG